MSTDGSRDIFARSGRRDVCRATLDRTDRSPLMGWNLQHSEAVAMMDLLQESLPTAGVRQAERIKKTLQDMMPSELPERPDAGESRT